MPTVRELIEELRRFPEDHLVVLSRDREGNGFRPVDGSFSLGLWDTDEREMVFEYEDEETGDYSRVPAEDRNAVVLWPV